VRDDLTNLAKDDINLYVDGRRRTTFSYNTATDRLSYGSGRLSTGRHTVRIIAIDTGGNRSDESWSFAV
jgi:hypothetical protein